MKLIDYIIFLVPMIGVLALGFYSRKYIRGVVDFLSAGRLCGRYLLTIGDIANGISIVSVLSYVERKYAVGFAVDFWNRLLLPLLAVTAMAFNQAGLCGSSVRLVPGHGNVAIKPGSRFSSTQRC